VIGAEHLLALRCRNQEVRRILLSKVIDVEEAAKATGEDIRSINPIPANIEAGISTLEEKSLGAISKAGTRMIEGVLRYGERPEHGGLYFMDSWMSSTSLFLGYAAAGAVLNIFQLGGMVLPDNPVLPSMATGIVAPILYTTGNPRTYSKGIDEIDFNAGTIISNNNSIKSVAVLFSQKLCAIAGGTLVKTETLKYQDQAQVYFTGPNL
jgi:altronate dehydratase large subunit